MNTGVLQYLEKRKKKVSEKALNLICYSPQDFTFLFTLWELQYWREKSEWQDNKLQHKCNDVWCPICDPNWLKFINCEADYYKPCTD